MGKSPLRVDKTCLNCNYVVENRFCPNCGQENIETRKTFHHLFVHFFEDLTHYENAFWKTIRNLILKPSSLTKEYLSGKRMSYLAPVRLYIFISFVTFLILSLLPSRIDFNNGKEADLVQARNTINNEIAKETGDKGEGVYMGNLFYRDLKQLDSLQKYGPEDEKLSPFEYDLMAKVIRVTEENTATEIKQKFLDSFVHNFPKVLFIYMPLFAFFLWLFHSKKKWYYFDHGIFTLHYFSFLLLTVLIITLLDEVVFLFGENVVANFISNSYRFIGSVWMFYYFFPAHHRFYENSRGKSIVKGTLLFFINMFFITLLLVAFAFYTFINIH